MNLLRDRTVSFIVRVWREDGEGSGGSEWRGSIEHVQSGHKAFFRDLAAIGHIIEPYLGANGDAASSVDDEVGE